MAGGLFLSSCGWMEEDLSDCPTGLYVNFVYDYNIQQADMFKDHVGSVTLYVYDESERLVASKTMGEGQLSTYGSYIHFTEDELAPDHTYRRQVQSTARAVTTPATSGSSSSSTSTIRRQRLFPTTTM